jgi:hypothetical protein
MDLENMTQSRQGRLTNLEYFTTPPVMPVGFEISELSYRGELNYWELLSFYISLGFYINQPPMGSILINL